MKIKQVQNRDEWNKFVLDNNGSFLQSFEWGNFQHDYGRKVYRLGVEDNNQLIAGTQIVRYDLPAKRSYYFSPYGPVKYDKLILEEIQRLAGKKKIIFWRLEPREKLDMGQKVKDIHPKKTLILDLNKSENDLLGEMKQKARYNLRLAAKKGVRVKISDNIKDIDVFYNLISDTASRQSIKIFPRSYYQLMLHILGDQNLMRLYLAEYKGEIIAANLMIAFSDTMTYLHGGTSHEHRNVMAPYLLQWQAMMDAKNAGLTKYDFFGISDSIPSWQGITRFKRGFGGKEIEYSGTYEVPLNNIWYKGYNLIKKIKK
ncbi:MAG: peptidoglycan bridge formation glycyltransferase FemA/FemB family protein [Patescibacteria group bacterium]